MEKDQNANIPVPVLQVQEKEEKEENDKEKEEMEWKRRDWKEVQDGLVFKEVMMLNFPLSPSLLFPSPTDPASRFFPPSRS